MSDLVFMGDPDCTKMYDRQRELKELLVTLFEKKNEGEAFEIDKSRRRDWSPEIDFRGLLKIALL